MGSYLHNTIGGLVVTGELQFLTGAAAEQGPASKIVGHQRSATSRNRALVVDQRFLWVFDFALQYLSIWRHAPVLLMANDIEGAYAVSGHSTAYFREKHCLFPMCL